MYYSDKIYIILSPDQEIEIEREGEREREWRERGTKILMFNT